jgi:hypothetical protein
MGAGMNFRIHFTWPNGTEDSFDVSGSTVEEVREKAHEGVAARNGSDPWSEPIEWVSPRGANSEAWGKEG